jgi:hypothetical protein
VIEESKDLNAMMIDGAEGNLTDVVFLWCVLTDSQKDYKSLHLKPLDEGR